MNLETQHLLGLSNRRKAGLELRNKIRDYDGPELKLLRGMNVEDLENSPTILKTNSPSVSPGIISPTTLQITDSPLKKITPERRSKLRELNRLAINEDEFDI